MTEDATILNTISQTLDLTQLENDLKALFAGHELSTDAVQVLQAQLESHALQFKNSCSLAIRDLEANLKKLSPVNLPSEPQSEEVLNIPNDTKSDIVSQEIIDETVPVPFDRNDDGVMPEEKRQDLSSSNSPSSKKSSKGFGFKSMLSSLTKGRPKPKRAEAKSNEGLESKSTSIRQPETQSSPPLPNNEKLPSKLEEELKSLPSPPAQMVPLPERPSQAQIPEKPISPVKADLPQDLPPVKDDNQALTLEESEQPPSEDAPEVPVKKYIPSNAMSALASAMKAGLSGSDSNILDELKTKRPSIIDRTGTVESIASGTSTPPPVSIKPRPRPRSSSVNENDGPSTLDIPQARPFTYHEGDSSATKKSPQFDEQAPPPILPRLSRTSTSGIGPPVLPRSRPSSVAVDAIQPSGPFSVAVDAIQPSTPASPKSPIQLSNSESIASSPQKQTSSVSVDSHQTPAGSATSSQPRSPISVTTFNSQPDVEQSRTKEEEARYQLALKAQKSSPTKPNRQMMPIGPALTFKKKENSTSGDDKLLEKKSLEWINAKLSLKSLEPITNIQTCFSDGLTLIYALEAASGQSLGKYNKKAMMQVHRLDNITVAMAFLARRGLDVHDIAPQSLLDGDKKKVLTLFNRLLKEFPDN